MYAREHDNKVTIKCTNPQMSNLVVFWSEVQEYMDKGYRFDSDISKSTMMEIPSSMTFIRVTLMKEEAKVVPKAEDKPTAKVEAPAKATTKKTTAKKPAATK